MALELFLERVERTCFAVSTDETRYNLTGVYFEPIEDALRLVRFKPLGS